MRPKAPKLTNLETSLLEASKNGESKKCTRLIKLGTRVDVVDKHRATPLIISSAEGHLPVVKLLLRAGADFSLKTVGGNTALSYAAYNGHLDICKELLEAGANVNAFIDTPAGRVPVLVFVAAKGYREIVELFLNHGATLNPKKAEVLPLQYAAEGSNIRMVKYLLASGADINRSQELCGYTALMMAALKSSVQMIRLLIQSGADVNARNKIGMTALCYASRRGELAIVKELLRSGANIELGYEDPNGKYDAIEMARQRGHPKVEKLLENWRDRRNR